MQKVVVIRPLLKGKTLDPRIIGTDHPGTYRWWFHGNSLKYLGLSTNNNLLCSSKSVVNGQTYYALYFGIAVKETIRKRLNWHINQKHSTSNMKSNGPLSTLRRTLGALLLYNNPKQSISIANSQAVIDGFMDKYCVVEWMPYTSGGDIKKEIEAIETAELKNPNYWYPLNLDKNNSPCKDKVYSNELSKKRKSFSEFFSALSSIIELL